MVIPGSPSDAKPEAEDERSRGFLVIAAAGAVASCAVVAAGGQVGPIPGTVPLSYWFEVLSRTPVNPSLHHWPGLLLVASIVALGGVWALSMRRVVTLSVRQLWWLLAAWAAPFVAGPPILSDDLASYVGHGMLSIHDLTPYTSSPAALGSDATVAAIDPLWRGALSPYGPLATLLEHVAVFVAGGSPLLAALLLRAVAVGGVVAIGWLALVMYPARGRQAFALTALNPVVLLQIVSAAHWEGAMCALMLGALAAAQRRWWIAALVLGCAAGMVKAPGFVIVVVVIAALWAWTPLGRRPQAMARAVAVVALAMTVFSVSVPHGWGWLRTLATPAQGWTPASPATALAVLLHPLLVWTHVASADTVLNGCRAAGVVVAAAVAGYVLITWRRRANTRTAGCLLIVAAVFGPVIYPWYLLWGSVCLAVDATRHRRALLVIGSLVASVMSVQGLTVVEIGVIASVTVACALIATSLVFRSRYQRTGPGVLLGAAVEL